MVSGVIITRALNRVKMPVNDYATRRFALEFLNEILQEFWNLEKWRYRVSRFDFNTSNNVEEYILSKFVDWIMPFTVRGTDPVRMLQFEPSHDFYKFRQYSLDSGNPYHYRYGAVYGISTNVSASSQITISSTLANYTTGTVTISRGGRRATGAGGATFTRDMIGRSFRIGSDEKYYKVTDFIDSTNIDISEPYEGTGGSGLSYTIGDIDQLVTVEGLNANSQVIAETVQLTGSTTVTTSNFFSSLIRITKSAQTYGSIVATSNGGVVENIRLAPGELAFDSMSIKLYPIPTAQERIEYEAYTTQPQIYNEWEAPLTPAKYHSLFLAELQIRLSEEFLGKAAPQSVFGRRDSMLRRMYVENNDYDEWDSTQETRSRSIVARSTNLPNNYEAFDSDDI